MLSAQSVYAVYGTDDVDNDNSEKTTSYGTEVEINEFVLLDAMPHITIPTVQQMLILPTAKMYQAVPVQSLSAVVKSGGMPILIPPFQSMISP